MLKVHQASLYSITFHYSTSAHQLHVIDSRGIDRSIPGKRLTYFRQFILQQPGHQPGHRRLSSAKTAKIPTEFRCSAKKTGARRPLSSPASALPLFPVSRISSSAKKPFSRSLRQSHYVPARRRRRIGFGRTRRRRRLRCRPPTRRPTWRWSRWSPLTKPRSSRCCFWKQLW